MSLIVVDPGHGGRDPGAVGYVVEKEVNLQIAKAAEKRLLQFGADVIKTRDGDYGVSLESRVWMANNLVDVFVSIHCNGGRGMGFESFRATDGDPQLQKCIHDQILKLGVFDRGPKVKDFYVLRNAKVPAVLCECLFVDTLGDAALLKDPAFVERMGFAIADGVAKYLGIEEDNRVFKDVDPKRWSAETIKLAVDLGLMGGFPDGTFKPTEALTREQAASVLTRLFFLTHEEEKVKAVITNCAPAVATVYAGTSSGGSGFFVADKLLVTNAHVVNGVNKVLVATRQGKFEGEVERRGCTFDKDGNVTWAEKNVAIDLATVRITKKAEEAAVWGDGFPTVRFAAEAPPDGAWMIVIGSPLLIQDWKSLGIVSRQTDYFINTDAAINPGNSGGAAFSLAGELVGVPTYKYAGVDVDNMAGIIKAQAVRLWLDGKHEQIKF